MFGVWGSIAIDNVLLDTDPRTCSRGMFRKRKVNYLRLFILVCFPFGSLLVVVHIGRVNRDQSYLKSVLFFV